MFRKNVQIMTLSDVT